MTDSDSDVSLGDAVTNTGKWTPERIRLLIQLRLEMEAQFRSLFKNGRSRHSLWPHIYNKLKAADPELTETLKNVQKKFNNLMLTYKRIKSSPRNINQSRWEFFDDFNDILSQFSDTTTDENEPTNVRYVKVYKVDDDSVSFSSDDCDTPSNYKNVVAFKPKPPIKPTVTYTNQSANGTKRTDRFAIVNEPEVDTNKRKLTDTEVTNVGKVQKKLKNSTTATTDSIDDNSSWFREYVKMNEKREQQRYEQHEQRMELERERIEIETKNGQTLRELVDVFKKFVNKSS